MIVFSQEEKKVKKIAFTLVLSISILCLGIIRECEDCGHWHINEICIKENCDCIKLTDIDTNSIKWPDEN